MLIISSGVVSKMSYRIPRTVRKSFDNYSKESQLELKELSKLNIKVATGKYTEQKVYISIDKPKAIEIRIYDLSNFSKNVYNDFNRRVKKLAQ